VNGRSRPLDKGGSRDADYDDTDSIAQQLHRRAQAARGADPWTADQQEWRDAWDVLMARLGWAPKWQRERARELWEAGVR
jgi:hypothetical protein